MLKGKNVIVTGARKGIGRAVVEKLAINKANVWACARSYDIAFENDMCELSEEYGVSINPVYFDLNNETEVKEAIRAIIKEHVNIDALINNAGIAQYEKLQLMKIENAKQIFNNNFFSTLYLTQLVMRKLTRETGSIVFVSSISGYSPEIGNIAYGGSKIAISHATKVLALELAEQKIRVNAVSPGLVDTDMKNLANEASWKAMLNRTTLKRAARPGEIANVICFLISEQASYINGQIIHVDGGFF